MKPAKHLSTSSLASYLLSGGFLALLLVLALRLPGDPDMGWHLRNGQDLIARLHFPIGDPYSWTMPNFNWVPHEWVMDIVMAAINYGFGLWGLVIFFAVLVGAIFFFAAGVYKTDLATRSLVAVIALSVAWHIVGVRPQMVTLLGLAVVLFLLFRFRDHPRPKSIYWLPVVFLVWANLHGGFAVGFLAIAVFVVGEGIRRLLLGKLPKAYPAGLLSWPMTFKLGWVSLISLAATLVNPSGWGVYRELYQTISNSYVLDNISEWLSVTVLSPASYNLVILSILLVALLFINRWQFDTTKLVLAIVFFWFGVESWRHVPLFVIGALPLLAEQLAPLMQQSLKELARWWPLHLGVWLLAAFILNNYLHSALPVMRDPAVYANRLNYPYGAVQYLKTSTPPKRLLNEYNWGGYLLWQYPEAKVFIDGRMAIWSDDGINIFREFNNALGDDPTTAVATLKQWQVDTILTYTGKPINQILGSADSDWEIGYRDNLATVWRPK